MRILALGIAFILLTFTLSAKGDLDKFSTKSNTITFTENKGQVSDQNYKPRPDVLFSGEANGMVFHLRNDGVSYQLYNRISAQRLTDSTAQPELGGIGEAGNRGNTDSIVIHRIDIDWIGANKDFEIEYGEATQDYTNYYLAVCPDGITGVKSYKDITFKNVWDGIDIKWYNKEGSLEYDFIVAPDADYKAIKWAVNGSKPIINDQGDLVMATPIGEVHELSPIAIQDSKERKIKFQLKNNILEFNITDFNTKTVLIIDPFVKNWCTLYGGPGDDYGQTIEVDAMSNLYMGGGSNSTSNIATSGSFQTTLSGDLDVFLAKLNANGVRQWGTYFGGSQAEYLYTSCLDSYSNIYLAGWTLSSGLGSPGCHQPNNAGMEDGFIVKFNSSGIRQWSTYYGGANKDWPYSITSDISSEIIVAGTTRSSGGIATTGAHRDTLWGYQDAFMVKFSNSGQRLWGTYFGGSLGGEGASSCTTDNSSNIYLCGGSQSSNGIATPGTHADSLYPTSFPYGDAFIAKFNMNGSLIWGTYYGGESTDGISGSVVLNGSQIYVCGTTRSDTGIATVGTHQVSRSGNNDGFVAKFDSTGNLVWGTYYGGPDTESKIGIDAQSDSAIYVFGNTNSSTGLSTLNGYQPIGYGIGMGYFGKFSSTGNLLYGSYYQGGGVSLHNYLNEGAIRGSDFYITGRTDTYIDMSTPGSHQTYLSGTNDGYLAKFNHCQETYGTDTVSKCGPYTSPSGNHLWDSSGVYLDTVLNFVGCDSIITIHLTITSSVDSTLATTACDSGVVALKVFANPGKIYWYDDYTLTNLVDSGFTITTPFLTQNRYYYVEYRDSICEIPQRFPMVAEVYHQPDITQFMNGVRCGPGSVTLSAYGNGMEYWYDSLIGGTLLDSGQIFNTPFVSVDTVFYVEAVHRGCASNRIPVSATIKPVPVVNSTIPSSRCDAGSVTLSATSSLGDVLWYAAPTGGSVLFTGNSYTTPPISSTTSFYAEAVFNGCTSLTRTPVVATVKTTPSITSTTPSFTCDSGNVILSASASAGSVRWYENAVGGVALVAGTSFSTFLTATKTYYVDANLNGCTTATRTPVIASVYSTPSILSTSPGKRCGPGSVLLSASASHGVINWYPNSMGGGAVGNGNQFLTPVITTNTTFWAEASYSGCLSNRVSVLAEINKNSTHSITETVCYSYTSPSGKYKFWESGVYKDTLVNSIGCDSIITINLTIPKVDTAVSIQGSELVSHASSAGYQWLNCAGGITAIGNATNRTFIPPVNGMFAVEVTQNNCVDTSRCVDVFWVGIEENASAKIHIYPNPTNNLLTIDLGKIQAEVSLILRNDLGQIIIRNNYLDIKNIELDLSEIPPGIYSLTLYTKEGNYTQNVIKK